MNIRDLEKNVKKGTSQAPVSYTPHEISVNSIPLSGLITGAIPMLFVLFARFGCLLAFFMLPTVTAIFVTVFVVGLNYIITPPTGLKPGVMCARPETERQSRISDALGPFAEYSAPWWCIDAHWATLLPILLFKLPRRTDMLFQELKGSDGCSLTLEWFIPRTGSVLKGVILAIPGLNGSTNGGYMVDLVERMSEEGYAVAALSGRGSGCSQIDSIESSFHLARSDDLFFALEGVEKNSGDAPIYILGFSAGGVRAVSFAAKYGEKIKGRVSGILSFGGSVSNENTMKFPSSVFVYQPVIMHAYVSTFMSKLSKPEMAVTQRIRTFVDFDIHVTTKIHDISLQEYYEGVFSKKHLQNIQVPTLIVNSIDDPVLHVSDAIVSEFAQSNSNITLLATAKGGHIGWPTGIDQKLFGYKWISQVAQTFIRVIQ